MQDVARLPVDEQADLLRDEHLADADRDRAAGPHLRAGIRVGDRNRILQPEEVERGERVGDPDAIPVSAGGSGTLLVGFKNEALRTYAGKTLGDVAKERGKSVEDTAMDELFAATVEATEEAVVNALWAAPDVTGREGRLQRGLPHDDVLELLERHGALA